MTAACMLCRADAFRDVGMFDEANLTVAFNDVDLCLRIGRAGYRVIMNPAFVAEHHESLSRGSDLLEHNLPRFYGENQLMMDRWRPLIESDPYYNPHFSHETGMFEKFSNASLKVDRAPSLLRKPVPRAVLPEAKPTQPITGARVEAVGPRTRPTTHSAPLVAKGSGPKKRPAPQPVPPVAKAAETKKRTPPQSVAAVAKASGSKKRTTPDPAPPVAKASASKKRTMPEPVPPVAKASAPKKRTTPAPVPLLAKVSGPKKKPTAKTAGYRSPTAR